MIEQAVQLFFSDWFAAFFDPQKRIFFGYLLAALSIALLWLVFYQKRDLRFSVKEIFSFKHWLSASARADYYLMIINGALMTLLSPALLANASIAAFIFTGLHSLFDGRVLIANDVSAEIIALSFTLFLFVFDDFARYWLHRWLHTFPILWSFHKVHHSATVLNPFTVFRAHPIEAVLFTVRSALVQGVSIAVFIYFFGDKVTLFTVLGANIFGFFFNLLGSNLRHSPVSIGYWHSVERVFISPAQHHIHHSHAVEHIDKNFGVVFAFWDYWFGSHHFSEKNQTLSYGLAHNMPAKPHTLFNLYLNPFKDAWSYLKGKTSY